MFSKAVCILLLVLPLAAAGSSREGQELLGSPAPALKLDRWVNSAALEIDQLKGKCYYCAGGRTPVSCVRPRRRH